MPGVNFPAEGLYDDQLARRRQNDCFHHAVLGRDTLSKTCLNLFRRGGREIYEADPAVIAEISKRDGRPSLFERRNGDLFTSRPRPASVLAPTAINLLVPMKRHNFDLISHYLKSAADEHLRRRHDADWG